GELVVHRRVAQDIVRVFARLYASRFPIEEMRLTTAADIAAPPTGDGNNTAAFLCRGALGQQDRHRRWSSHAYGVAIDINPFQNPYRYGSLLLPELAFAYTDRKWRRPGMIQAGDVVTHSFADIGWAWGGTWTSRLDYMDFSESGECRGIARAASPLWSSRRSGWSPSGRGGRSPISTSHVWAHRRAYKAALAP